MLEFRTQGFNGYAVKYSPFFDSRIAVAASANFGLVGNGRLYILGLTPNGIVAEKWYVYLFLPVLTTQDVSALTGNLQVRHTRFPLRHLLVRIARIATPHRVRRRLAQALRHRLTTRLPALPHRAMARARARSLLLRLESCVQRFLSLLLLGWLRQDLPAGPSPIHVDVADAQLYI